MPPVVSKRRPPETPLERFVRAHSLKPRRIAVEANVSRAHLLRIRTGEMEPTRPVMVRIARACARLTAGRVTVADLFDLDFVDLAAELESINPS